MNVLDIAKIGITLVIILLKIYIWLSANLKDTYIHVFTRCGVFSSADLFFFHQHDGEKRMQLTFPFSCKIHGMH